MVQNSNLVKLDVFPMSSATNRLMSRNEPKNRIMQKLVLTLVKGLVFDIQQL